MGLRQQAFKGVAWTSIGTFGHGGMNLLVTIVLARLLTPADFGLIELIVVFSAISDCIVDSGFSQAIIRDKNASSTDLSSVFLLNIFLGGLVYALLFLLAPVLSKFYESNELLSLSRFVFLTVVFNSFSVVQNANLSRNLDFRPYALASIIAIIISGFIAIIMALKGFGVWALATNLVVFSFGKMVMLWVFSRWRPSWRFSLGSVKKYFSFSVYLLVQGLVDKVVSNLESLVIGKVYTKSDLGFFSQGRKLDSYVVQTGSSIIQKVAYPLLSKMETGNQLKDGYRRVLGITMCLFTPVIGLMICGADDIMIGVFGHHWLPAADYLRLWSICGLCISFHTIFINAFMVTENSGLLLKCSLTKQALRITSILILVRMGIMPMMIGIVCVSIISALIYSFFGGRLINYCYKEIIIDLYKILLSGLIASVSSLIIVRLLVTDSGLLSLCFMAVMIGSLYVGLLLLFKDKSFMELFGLLKNGLKKIRNHE